MTGGKERDETEEEEEEDAAREDEAWSCLDLSGLTCGACAWVQAQGEVEQIPEDTQEEEDDGT